MKKVISAPLSPTARARQWLARTASHAWFWSPFITCCTSRFARASRISDGRSVVERRVTKFSPRLMMDAGFIGTLAAAMPGKWPLRLPKEGGSEQTGGDQEKLEATASVYPSPPVPVNVSHADIATK